MTMYYSEDLNNIVHQLASADIRTEVARLKKILMQLMSLDAKGIDTRPACPTVLKLLPSNDLIIKKLACFYILQQSQHDSDVILLAVNTLLNDCIHPNPMIRGLALKTITSFPHRNLVEYWVAPLLAALNDNNAYVRRIAVLACTRLWELDRDLIAAHDLVDELYSKLRDADPVVSSNCLLALDYILKEEGGIVINNNIAHFLLNRLGEFSECELVFVLQLLHRYSPSSNDETLDIMNVLDSLLKHTSSAVIIATFHYFIFLVKNQPRLRCDVFERARSQLLHFITGDHAELTSALLDFVKELLNEYATCLCAHFKAFFCRHAEPVYIKMKKLSILPSLVTDANIDAVLDELETNATDHLVSVEAIKSIGTVALNQISFSDKCATKLLGLLELQQDDIVAAVLSEMRAFNFQHCSVLDDILHAVSMCASSVTCTHGRQSILWFIAHYGCQIENAAYIMETYIDDARDAGEELSLQLLVATVKLFLVQPAECQEMLGGVLEDCIRSSQILLKDAAIFYYKLLQTDVQETSKLLTAQQAFLSKS